MGIVDTGFTSNALQQASGPGERQPYQQITHYLARNQQGKRSRYPQAETIKAVHQLAEEAGPNFGPQSKDKIGWAVLAGQQVGNPPDSEGSQDEAKSEAHFIHKRRHRPATSAGLGVLRQIVDDVDSVRHGAGPVVVSAVTHVRDVRHREPDYIGTTRPSL
jgi:hypothetical protein